eukprot:scaffold604_cov384-Prasinococcus_capsulatus_cf.AAC.3
MPGQTGLVASCCIPQVAGPALDTRILCWSLQYADRCSEQLRKHLRRRPPPGKQNSPMRICRNPGARPYPEHLGRRPVHILLVESQSLHLLPRTQGQSTSASSRTRAC